MIDLRMLRIEWGEGRSRKWYYMGSDGSFVIPTVQRWRFCVRRLVGCLELLSWQREYQIPNWIG